MSNLITKMAPDFIAEAIMGDNKIKSQFRLFDIKDKYIILFFYPLDFTFVCPTEILAFNEKLNEFKERDAEIIGVSIDSVYTHLAWKKTPVEQGGIGPINYPLVSDLKREIGKAYDVLLEEEIAMRATFIIDLDGIVRHAVYNDNSLGRSVGETLRMLDAIRHYDQHGKVCPANWEEGEESMAASTEGVIDYLSKFGKKD